VTHKDYLKAAAKAVAEQLKEVLKDDKGKPIMGKIHAVLAVTRDTQRAGRTG